MRNGGKNRKLILSSPLIKIISITKRNPRKYVNISNNNNNNFDNLSLSWKTNNVGQTRCRAYNLTEHNW